MRVASKRRGKNLTAKTRKRQERRKAPTTTPSPSSERSGQSVLGQEGWWSAPVLGQDNWWSFQDPNLATMLSRSGNAFAKTYPLNDLSFLPASILVTLRRDMFRYFALFNEDVNSYPTPPTARRHAGHFTCPVPVGAFFHYRAGAISEFSDHVFQVCFLSKMADYYDNEEADYGGPQEDEFFYDDSNERWAQFWQTSQRRSWGLLQV